MSPREAVSHEVEVRDLPPVKPLELEERRRRRFSMTLLRHLNRCNRSAYLYLKYRGGPPSHPLNRGSVAHTAFERYVRAMVDNGEHRIPMDLAKDIMADAIASSPATIPSEEQAKLRVMAAHFAEGIVIDPAQVVGVEQKVVLPIDEFVVVGKLDLLLRSADGVLDVWDWKTAMAQSTQDEIAEKLRDGRMAPKSFQLLVYVLLAAFGIPVESERCGYCEGAGALWSVPEGDGIRHVPARAGVAIEMVGDPQRVRHVTCFECAGAGSKDVPISDEPLGRGTNLFRAFEMYPMIPRRDAAGQVEAIASRGPLEVERKELIDHRQMLEGMVFKLAAMLGEISVPGIEPWKFEAVGGTHCQECPARGECPLPAHLRSFAGEVNDRAEAEEAAEKLELHQKPAHRAMTKELREWVKRNGAVRVGADKVLEMQHGTRRTTDTEGLAAAALEAAEFGTPFDPEAFVREADSSTLKLRTLEPDEFEGAAPRAAEEEPPETLDERFGTIDDVPF